MPGFDDISEPVVVVLSHPAGRGFSAIIIPAGGTVAQFALYEGEARPSEDSLLSGEVEERDAYGTVKEILSRCKSYIEREVGLPFRGN